VSWNYYPKYEVLRASCISASCGLASHPVHLEYLVLRALALRAVSLRTPCISSVYCFVALGGDTIYTTSHENTSSHNSLTAQKPVGGIPPIKSVLSITIEVKNKSQLLHTSARSWRRTWLLETTRKKTTKRFGRRTVRSRG